MRVKHRFVFRSAEDNIVSFLQSRRINIDYDKMLNVFEIYEDNVDFCDVKELLNTYNSTSLTQCIYTRKELDLAEWLTVRSTWQNDYPQPEDNFGYIKATYDTSNYCKTCENGLVQNNNFILKKKPNWGSKNFMMLNWVPDELFISDRVESVFCENNVKGLDYLKTYNRSKNEIKGTKQIYIQKTLDYGIKSESIEKEVVCDECKFKKTFTKTGYIYYDKHVFDNINIDLIKSCEKYGEVGCASTIFINQRVRKLIINNNFARGLVFEPIQLV